MLKAGVVAFAMLFVASSASAAEPQVNWSGFYAGIDVGGLFAKSPTTVPALPATADIKPNGFLGGGHIGYRWHAPASRWVFGVEADLWGVRADDDAPFLGFGNSAYLKVNRGGSLRGVAGFTANSALLYATGGAAYARFSGCILALGTNDCWQGYSDTAWGWTAGIGAAYALHPNLIARLEYLYADFGDHSYSTPAINGGITDVALKTHTLRAGLSWRFRSF